MLRRPRISRGSAGRRIRPPRIERTDLGGVPVRWAKVEGPQMLTVMFGTGRTSESLVAGGLNHLVEHLAIHALGHIDYAHNGSVELLRTLFWARGQPHEVASFVKGVVAALADLPFDRLATEADILRTEGLQRSPGIEGHLLWLRFGRQGPGLVAEQEYALQRPDPAALQAWSRAWFSRQNCAIWATFNPRDLELGLSDGLRPEPLEPIPTVQGRFQRQVDIGGIALGFLVERSTAARVGSDVIQQRATQLLRREAGVAYHVELSYLPIGPSLAHVMYHIPCEPENRDLVCRDLLRVVSEVSADGPTIDELEAARERTSRLMTDPLALPGALDFEATGALFADDSATAERILADHESMTAGEVAAAIGAGETTHLVLAPDGVTVPGSFPAYAAPTGRWITGPLVTAIDGSGATLMTSDEGIALRLASGEAPTARFGDIEGVLYSRRARGLMTRQGEYVGIAADEWPNGDAVIDLIDAKVPPNRYVPWPRGPRDPGLPPMFRPATIVPSDYLGPRSDRPHTATKA
jgi:hypothetical protein